MLPPLHNSTVLHRSTCTARVGSCTLSERPQRTPHLLGICLIDAKALHGVNEAEGGCTCVSRPAHGVGVGSHLAVLAGPKLEGRAA